jgi:uncharacterized protein (TIGR00290 family)
MKVFASWSGGKDSALATYEAISKGHEVLYLLNFINEGGERSRSHGVKADVLALQAESLGIPIIQVRTSWDDYEENFKKAILALKEEGIEGGVFGDIDLREHREWIEKTCSELNIQPILPLWGMDGEALLSDFMRLGFRSIVVASRLGEQLVGRDLDRAFLTEMRKLDAHLCGESGEYHTFVYDGPMFRWPIKAIAGDKVKRGNIWFSEIGGGKGG